MPKPPERPYEIVFLGRQEPALRAYGAIAEKCGLLNVYLAAFKFILHRLETDPVQWGDPQNRLQFMRLTLYHGIHDPLHASYAVDEQRRIVYVREIKPIPGRGLDDLQ